MGAYADIRDGLYNVANAVISATNTLYKGQKLWLDEADMQLYAVDSTTFTAQSKDVLHAWWLYRDGRFVVELMQNPRYDETHTWILEGVMAFNDGASFDTPSVFNEEVDDIVEALEDNVSAGYDIIAQSTGVSWSARIEPVRGGFDGVIRKAKFMDVLCLHARIEFPVTRRRIANT